jgi:phosphate-selective porin OprO/OprP
VDPHRRRADIPQPEPRQSVPGASQAGARGSWSLAHQLSIDDDAFTGGAASFANPATAARKAKAVGVGLNWYLNQNVKWQLDYELTRFDGGAATGDRRDEQACFTRVGLSF